MNFKHLIGGIFSALLIAGLSSTAFAQERSARSASTLPHLHKASSPPATVAPNSAADSDIGNAVDDALKNDKIVRYEDIRVNTNSGVVTLSGVVSSAFQSIRAQQIASTVDGVKAVNNHLMIIALSSAVSDK